MINCGDAKTGQELLTPPIDLKTHLACSSIPAWLIGTCQTLVGCSAKWYRVWFCIIKDNIHMVQNPRAETTLMRIEKTPSQKNKVQSFSFPASRKTSR
jgi:hypothetical protein